MKGWRYESARHALAARGIASRRYCARSLPEIRADMVALDAQRRRVRGLDEWFRVANKRSAVRAELEEAEDAAGMLPPKNTRGLMHQMILDAKEDYAREVAANEAAKRRVNPVIERGDVKIVPKVKELEPLEEEALRQEMEKKQIDADFAREEVLLKESRKGALSDAANEREGKATEREGKATEREVGGEKKGYYAYAPTYVSADLPVIGADAVGTAGAAAVSYIPIIVPFALAYGGATLIAKRKRERAKKGKGFFAQKSDMQEYVEENMRSREEGDKLQTFSQGVKDLAFHPWQEADKDWMSYQRAAGRSPVLSADPVTRWNQRGAALFGRVVTMSNVEPLLDYERGRTAREATVDVLFGRRS